MPATIKQPETDAEFKQYFNLRWRILRAPWGKPEGSEKDELEDSSIHIMACEGNDNLIGIGRLQFNHNSEAQIRYMAVEPAHEGEGAGRQIVHALEKHSRDRGYTTVILHAREPAVGFYKKLGYEVTEKSYLLFGCIQHYKMSKHLL